jgi:hypothetical protein
MQINRSNYEIWFIDWLDEKLNSIQTESLMHFLNENPDLKEELDEINTLHLKPSEKKFLHKNHLKKSSANITESQFEYLCVAYYENDLSPDEGTELKEIVDHDPEKRKVFDLFRKTKLSLPAISYKEKKLLIKRTIGKNVIRIAIVGLSAAAITIFSIIAFNTKSNILPDKSEKTSQNIQSSVGNGRDRSLQLDYSSNGSKKIISDAGRHIALNRFPQPAKMTNPAVKNLPPQQDSLPTLSVKPPIIVEKITRSTQITLEGNEIAGSLIALHYNAIIPQDYDNGQSRFSKFIAKAIRGKLLREKTPKDSPLKAYEVAEAGISGLNKLFGWEMALDERKDENGKLKSVYFSSKILKFNAPVKKGEPVK